MKSVPANLLIALAVSGMLSISRTTTIVIPTDYPTIQSGIEHAGNGDTVLVKSGHYYENITIDNRSVYLLGESGPHNTIIYGQGNHTVQILNNSSNIQGFTFRDGLSGMLISMADQDSITVRNNIFWNNGTGVIAQSISNSVDFFVAGNLFENNSDGGGIRIQDISARIFNNIFLNNSSEQGGAVSCVSAVLPGIPLIINNTFVRNSADEGGAVYIGWDTDALIMNNIISGTLQGSGVYTGPGGSTSNSYNDLWMNTGGGYTNCTSGSGDLFTDPCLSEDGSFHLQPGSPCIDAGNPLSIYNDQDSSRNDMGSTGGPYANFTISTGITESEEMSGIPERSMKIDAYPNPSNSRIQVVTRMPEPGVARLAVYDTKGQLVDILFDGYLPAGQTRHTWDTNRLSSGVYFIRSQWNNHSASARIIHIK